MEKTYVIRYSNGHDTKLSTPMSMNIARKQAQWLYLNGYEVEITELDARTNSNKRVSTMSR